MGTGKRMKWIKVGAICIVFLIILLIAFNLPTLPEPKRRSILSTVEEQFTAQRLECREPVEVDKNSRRPCASDKPSGEEQL